MKRIFKGVDPYYRGRTQVIKENSNGTIDCITEVEGEPIDRLLGKEVYVMCASYAYTGNLSVISNKMIELSDPKIVYETGSWDNKEWKDAQRLPTDRLILSLGSVECIFEVKH